MSLHADMADAELHVGGYVQSSDPGAVGAGILWFDTTDSKVPILKMRNAGDSGWDVVSDPTAIPHYSKGTGTWAVRCFGQINVAVQTGDTVYVSAFDLIRALQGGAASPTYTFYIKKFGGSYGAGSSDPLAEVVSYVPADAGFAQVVIKVNDGSNDTEEVTCAVSIQDTT